MCVCLTDSKGCCFLCPGRVDGGSWVSNRGSQVTGEYARCHSLCLSGSSLIKGQLRAGKQPGSLRAMSISTTRSLSQTTHTHHLQKHTTIIDQSKTPGQGSKNRRGWLKVLRSCLGRLILCSNDIQSFNGAQSNFHLNKNGPLCIWCNSHSL